MTSIFNKEENEPTDNFLPAFKVDSKTEPEITEPETASATLSKEEIVEIIKEYKQGEDTLVFEDVSPIDYNFIYSKFNRCHFRPRYKHETRQVFYP